jgi:hypothetical protein
VDSLVSRCTKTVEKEYDWAVAKSADQPSFSLAPGQSKTVTYTVTVTRDQGRVLATSHAVGATLRLSNTGDYITQDLYIKFYVEHKVPNSNLWATVPGSVHELADPAEIGAGASQEYSYGPVAFTPVSGATTYRMVAYVTHSVHGGTGERQEITHRADMTIPSTATGMIETDATADLTDLLGSAPAGSEFVYDGPHGPWHMTGSGTLTYKATIKNNSLSGAATFTNNVRLVEGDSNETRTAQASVLVGVSTAGLSAYDPASIAINRAVSYNWGLDKSIVGPAVVTIPLGQTRDIDYAFSITRVPVYTEVTGTMASAGVTVTNSGSDPVTVSKVTVKVQHRYPAGTGLWRDVVPTAKWEVMPGNVIASGGSYLYGPYQIGFAPVTGAEYRTHVEATTSGGTIATHDHVVAVTYSETPAAIKEVRLRDVFTNLVGLAGQGLEILGADPVTWTDPSQYNGNQCTLMLKVRITNRSAVSGSTLYLDNTATLTVSYEVGPDVSLTDTARATIRTTGQTQVGGDSQLPSGTPGPQQPGTQQTQNGSQPPAGTTGTATSGQPSNQTPLLSMTPPAEPAVAQPRPRPLPYTGGNAAVYVAIGAFMMGIGILLRRR